MPGSVALFDQLVKGRMIPSKCYGSRKGRKVRLGVFHTAEGIIDAADLGHFFAPLSRQASSQVGIDDRKTVRYVQESDSAWTAGNANPVSTQVELCAFARWSVAQWRSHKGMLEQAAQWAAAVSVYHGIPLVRVRGAATATGTGFCMHIDATKGFGGNHVDCGPAFSDVIFDEILARARQIVGGAIVPETGDDDVVTPADISAIAKEVVAQQRQTEWFDANGNVVKYERLIASAAHAGNVIDGYGKRIENIDARTGQTLAAVAGMDPKALAESLKPAILEALKGAENTGVDAIAAAVADTLAGRLGGTK